MRHNLAHPTGAGSGTCIFSQAVTASPNFPASSLSSCTLFDWVSATDTVTSVAVNDTDTGPCPGSPPTVTETYAGNAGFSLSELYVDLSKGTYNYNAEPAGNLVWTLSGCEPVSSPANPALYPASNWPQKFSLPSTVQPLTVKNFSFQGLYTLFSSLLVIPWTYFFTLNPTYDDCGPCVQDQSWAMR